MTRKRIVPATMGWLILPLLVFCLAVPSGRAASAAGGDIRVALFISARGTVPAVTMESGSGLSVAVQAGGPAVGTAPGKPVRFTPAGYSLIVRETPDRAAALAAYEAAAPHGYAELLADELSGRTVYQVRLAGFASRAEAEAAAGRLPAAFGAPAVAGPLYASAGTFASADEAAALQSLLLQQGIRAWLAVHPDADGFGTHSVWFGEAATEQELERAMDAVRQLLPSAAVHRPDASMPYLLAVADASPGLGSAVHYKFNRTGQEIRVTAGGAPIKVHERYGRTYRGSMAVTVHEGKLAVINELPLEEYLYAVVASEMPSSWPLEALKAQAVAARTYALRQGWKYGIAHVSDTTYDQAYNGLSAETPAAVAAVEATRGEVLADASGRLVEPLYASNHGGRSAHPSEVWGGDAPHVKAGVASPDDSAAAGRLDWYRIMLADGTSGYIRSDYAAVTGAKSDSGLPIVEVTGDGVNIRRAPYVDNAANPPVAQANRGDRFVMIGRDPESNAYSWIRGPYSAEQLKAAINARSPGAVRGSLATLEVTGRGPTGRVTEVSANGVPVKVSYPDQYRSALNGLPSTMFSIEETGRYTVLGAFGAKTAFPRPDGGLAVLSGDGQTRLSGGEFYIMNADGFVRAATAEPAFRFIGNGFGHGLGMSQYGAKSLAESGYDYRAILQYYYSGVHIVKE
jgi:stage II sporulation protein D